MVAISMITGEDEKHLCDIGFKAVRARLSPNQQGVLVRFTCAK